jgi:CheY-like chemotaxis protein
MQLRTVLVVDDHPPSRLLARISLERLGPLTVSTASSGVECLERAIAEVPDLILLDVTMPAMDGVEVLARLRADSRTAMIPVIFLTARAMHHELARLRATDALGVITKPFLPQHLPAEIRRLLGAPKPMAKGSVGSAAINAALAAAGRPTLDAPKLRPRRPTTRPPKRDDANAPIVRLPRRRRVLVIDDEEMCGTMVQRALRRDCDLTVLTSGAAALERIDAGERFDVILCDLCMPVVSGEDVLRTLNERVPEQAARLVVMTGGPQSTAAAAFLTRMATRVLWKPFDRAALLMMIDQLSAGDQPAAT